MSDKSRERFEAWCHQQWHNPILDRFMSGDYGDPETQRCWEAWQARDAEVKELVEALSDITDAGAEEWGNLRPCVRNATAILAKHEG